MLWPYPISNRLGLVGNGLAATIFYPMGDPALAARGPIPVAGNYKDLVPKHAALWSPSQWHSRLPGRNVWALLNFAPWMHSQVSLALWSDGISEFGCPRGERRGMGNIATNGMGGPFGAERLGRVGPARV